MEYRLDKCKIKTQHKQQEAWAENLNLGKMSESEPVNYATIGEHFWINPPTHLDN